MADETPGAGGNEEGELEIKISASGEKAVNDALDRIEKAAEQTDEALNAAFRKASEESKRQSEESAKRAEDNMRRFDEFVRNRRTNAGGGSGGSGGGGGGGGTRSGNPDPRDFNDRLRDFAAEDARRRRDRGESASSGLASVFLPGGQRVLFGNQAERKKKEAEAQRALNREIQEEVRLLGVVMRTSDVTSRETVSNLRENIAAQREWLKSVGASQLQIARLDQSVNAFEKRVTLATAAQRRSAEAAARAANQTRILGVSMDTVNGSLNRFGRSGLTLLNAVSFGLSTMAATGVASFRSLASASASFLAIFGPGGAIASAVISLGLVFGEMWNRQRQEMQETREKALEEMRKLRREIELETRQGDVTGLTDRAKAIQEGTVDRAGVVDLQQQIRQLDKDLADKRADLTRLAEKLTIDERQVYARQIAGLEARRRTLVVELATLEDEIATLASRAISAPLARQDRKAIEVTAQRDKEGKDELELLEKELNALVNLAEIKKSTAADLGRSLPIRVRLKEIIKAETDDVIKRAKAEQLLQKELQNTLGIKGLDNAYGSIISSLAPRRLDLTKQLQQLTKAPDTRDIDATRASMRRLYGDLIMSSGASERLLADIVGKVAFSRETVTDEFQRWVVEAQNAAMQLDQVFASIPERLADSFASALQSAFSGGGMSGAVRAFTGALGNIFSEMGAALTRFGFIMLLAQAGLSNPFTSGPAMIAAGAALTVLGATLGGAATGARTGIGSNSRPVNSSNPRYPIEIERLISDPASPYGSRFNTNRTTPKPAEPNIYVFPLLNPNDAASQRVISQTRVLSKRRGLP